MWEKTDTLTIATASLGAVWASCAPEFGTRSVVDRIRQIEPTVLLAINPYYAVHFLFTHEFIAFVKEAKARGIRVILDIVYNHSGNAHWALCIQIGC